MRAIIISLLVIVAGVGQVQADEQTESTQSPFFVVTTEFDGEIDALPLKSTTADVVIAGVIAEVVITQKYENSGNIPLEATYVFPGSTRAAVHGMQMKIGDRIRKAKIKRKAEAKKTYAKAKKEGKSATLLVQKRPNVFQMNVANIMPGDTVEVQLSYTELLVPQDGMYQFVYPTVVGPRYQSKSEASSSIHQSEEWIQNPFTSEGQLPSYTFGIDLSLRAGMPIQKIASNTHKINVNYQDQESAKVSLDSQDAFGGNRDFILSYKLQGDAIESGLLLFEGDEENFFLLMAQPPKQVTPEIIPPREYIFVVDVSGSMHGFPLNVSKTLLKNLVTSLKPSDKFNVILFAGGSAALAEESLAATPENVAEAVALFERQRGGGGTELLPALRRALEMPSSDSISRSIVVVTDGYISAETRTFDLIRKNLGNANLFSFGIGSSVNRFLLEGLARVGGGEPFVITKASEASYAAEKFRKYISSPVLTNIQVEFSGFNAYDIEPLSQPDLFAERPLLVFGKWKGAKRGEVKISGIGGEGKYRDVFPLNQYKSDTSLSALRYLWARHRIMMLSDYNAARSSDLLVDDITNIGLQYSLLTKYTSFVAVDELVRNPSAEGVTVKQALPLPQGVSNHAVGNTFAVPSVPEPETYALLLVLGLCLLWFYREQLSIQFRQRHITGS